MHTRKQCLWLTVIVTLACGLTIAPAPAEVGVSMSGPQLGFAFRF